jgi:hypothetical protein
MLAVFAWILSILGIAVTYIFLLGAAMSTVPQKLNVPSAIALAILPVVVLIGVGWALWKGAQPIGKGLLLYGVPGLLSVITLFMIVTSVKLPRMSGPYTEYFGKNTDQPRYRLEIRAAATEPKDGWTRMPAVHGGSTTWYVGDEVLFTHADLYNTTTFRETRHGLTSITLAFHGGAQPRVQELSTRMQGGYWAILLDGELWMVCRIQDPLERELTLWQQFDPKEAADWASGMVWE